MKKLILKKEIYNLLPILYLLISIVLAIPSVIYLIKNRTIYYFTEVFTYTFMKVDNIYNNYLNAIIYIGLFFLLFFLYFYILKRVNDIFKKEKKMFIFICIIGILFSIIIPTTSLDVYSYIGNGWVDSHYQENPYYTSVQDITNKYGRDEMLGKVARCWRNEPVVYGPIWSIICKILTSFSCGNINFALFTFKLCSFIIFMLCSLLIYKITRKRMFTLIFALNPFILFEFLSNVHNDIFLVLFILLAIYFVKNKKNITLAVASIAIATGIKYLSILLLPFLLIYALREEETKNKIKKMFLYGIEFIGLLIIFYAFYVRDLSVLSGIFVQQNKYGRSIFLAIYYFLNGDKEALSLIKIVMLGIFTILYIIVIFKLFFNKNITFRKVINIYQTFLISFIFILITNFNPWYVIWLFPSMFWQKAQNIRCTLYLSLGALISYVITYATRIDSEIVGIPYLIVTFLPIVVLEIIRKLNKKRK